jgi:hypothetical protein
MHNGQNLSREILGREKPSRLGGVTLLHDVEKWPS